MQVEVESGNCTTEQETSLLLWNEDVISRFHSRFDLLVALEDRPEGRPSGEQEYHLQTEHKEKRAACQMKRVLFRRDRCMMGSEVLPDRVCDQLRLLSALPSPSHYIF